MQTATTNSILDRIVAEKRDQLARDLARRSLVAVRAAAEARDLPLPFAPALAGEQLALIAEVKKASPSKGVLEQDFDPVARAQTYANGGASAISVLTEERSFRGSLDHITAIAGGVAQHPPLLRKDFLFDPYHLYEARAAGADAVLLIAAVLPDALLADLLALAAELSLGALVEVHDEAELARVLPLDAALIGINNRDLRTFHTDLAVTERLVPLIPDGRTIISESGIHTRTDALRLRALGVHAILVGEALMTSTDIPARMRELLV